jgi:hypothetical protein
MAAVPAVACSQYVVHACKRRVCKSKCLFPRFFAAASATHSCAYKRDARAIQDSGTGLQTVFRTALHRLQPLLVRLNRLSSTLLAVSS